MSACDGHLSQPLGQVLRKKQLLWTMFLERFQTPPGEYQSLPHPALSQVVIRSPLLLRIYPQIDLKLYINMYVQRFSLNFLICNNNKCLSTDNWLNKLWYTCTVEYNYEKNTKDIYVPVWKDIKH